MPIHIPFSIQYEKERQIYYAIGKEYNQLLYQMLHTKDDGVIISGNIRYMMDNGKL